MTTGIISWDTQVRADSITLHTEKDWWDELCKVMTHFLPVTSTGKRAHPGTSTPIRLNLKQEPNIRLIYECRCDERLKVKSEGSTPLTHTGLYGGLEHLKIETRLINERFVSAMGECVI